MDSFTPQTAEESIIATLAFFSIFEHPLRLIEIKRYLLKFDLQEEQIRALADNLPDIEHEHGFYCLRGEMKNIEKRMRQQAVYEKRMRKARFFLKFLKLVPFVRGVFICNNLSFGIATPEGDIDLFIVTEKDHLFLARFLVTGVLHVLGVRRHGKKVRGRFCLSFYAAENALDFSGFIMKPQDIYMAYWLKSLQTVSGEKVYNQLIQENSTWLESYFNKAKIQTGTEKKTSGSFYSVLQKTGEMLWQNFLGKRVERIIAVRQRKSLEQSYAKLSDKSGTIISEKMLKFHDQDKRFHFQTQWLKILSKRQQ